MFSRVLTGLPTPPPLRSAEKLITVLPSHLPTSTGRAPGPPRSSSTSRPAAPGTRCAQRRGEVPARCAGLGNHRSGLLHSFRLEPPHTEHMVLSVQPPVAGTGVGLARHTRRPWAPHPGRRSPCPSDAARIGQKLPDAETQLLSRVLTIRRRVGASVRRQVCGRASPRVRRGPRTLVPPASLVTQWPPSPGPLPPPLPLGAGSQITLPGTASPAPSPRLSPPPGSAQLSLPGPRRSSPKVWPHVCCVCVWLCVWLHV